MANRGPSGYINHSDGTPLDGVVTYDADFVSAWMDLVDPGDVIGFHVQNVNVGGTTTDLLVTAEASPDGGTTVLPFPDDFGAASSGISILDEDIEAATVDFIAYFRQCFPALAGWSWRLNFNFSGTIGDNAVTARRFQRSFGEDA